MFNVLTGCQAMQQLQINVSKNNAIHSLLQKQFPAIKSSDNKPTYYVTPNLKTTATSTGLLPTASQDFHPTPATNAPSKMRS